MPRLTLCVFDPNITENSPAGSCLLEMLRAARLHYDLKIFTAWTDLEASAGIRIRRMPLPRRPVFLQSILFTLLSVLFHLLATRHEPDLKIGTQGGFPFCNVSYAHCCHKLFLTSYRSQIQGGLLLRSARLLNHQWGAAMEAIAFRRASLIVVPSRGLAAELASAYGPAIAAKLHIITNPVDAGKFSPLQAATHRDPFTFAFCALGNFEWKGLGLILNALATGIPGHLKVIGGTNGEIEKFRQLAHSLGVGDRVTFLGFQSDIRPHLWSSDAFVFPSLYETFSLVCLQAAVAGLPLITTNPYGLEQVLRAGVSGWRVERTVESVGAAMRAAVSDRKKTAEMGRQARLLAQAYDIPAFQRSWLELLGR
jgi:glycosyltransferase involved in cell wall biosynthesis